MKNLFDKKEKFTSLNSLNDHIADRFFAAISTNHFDFNLFNICSGTSTSQLSYLLSFQHLLYHFP